MGGMLTGGEGMAALRAYGGTSRALLRTYLLMSGHCFPGMC